MKDGMELWELFFAKIVRCEFKVFRRAEESGKLTYSYYMFRFVGARILSRLRFPACENFRPLEKFVSFLCTISPSISFFSKKVRGATDKSLVCNFHPLKLIHSKLQTDYTCALKVALFLKKGQEKSILIIFVLMHHQFIKRTYLKMDKHVPYYLFIIPAIQLRLLLWLAITSKTEAIIFLDAFCMSTYKTLIFTNFFIFE